MGKAAAGTPKHLANAMKSKGLQKLIYFCQVCNKQNRDANGYKCHVQSEGHLRQMLVVGENAGKHIQDYSSSFQSEFVALLSRRWGTKRVRTNQVYQEYIQDKSHLHMNATRWLSLTEFTKHLGRTGIAHVDETEKGWFITWIDNSPKALAKSEASQKKERGDIDDETRQRRLIEEQISRARREGEKRKVEAAGGVWHDEAAPLDETAPEQEHVSSELNRGEGEKVSLSLSFKVTPAVVSPPMPSTSTRPDSVKVEDDEKPIASSSSLPSISLSTPALSLKSVSTFKATSLLKPNPLKRANPLKATSKAVPSNAPAVGPRRALSNVEQIVQDEMQRKARIAGNGSDPWEGRGRDGGVAKRPKYEFRG